MLSQTPSPALWIADVLLIWWSCQLWRLCICSWRQYDNYHQLTVSGSKLCCHHAYASGFWLCMQCIHLHIKHKNVTAVRQNWQLFMCLYCALGLSVQKLLCSYSGYTEVQASSGPSRGISPSRVPLRPHLHRAQAYRYWCLSSHQPAVEASSAAASSAVAEDEVVKSVSGWCVLTLCHLNWTMSSATPVQCSAQSRTDDNADSRCRWCV